MQVTLLKQQKEVVFIRTDLIYGWLKELAKHHADAGRPAHAAGVFSAASKIRREVSRSDKGQDHGNRNH